MSTIITAKTDNSILAIGENLTYQQGGNPEITVINSDGSEYKVAFAVNVSKYENVEIATGIEPGKHCYTPETGFYLNPGWEEANNQYGIPNEIYSQIEQGVVNEIEEKVANENPMEVENVE